jgi:hypothetical protein
MQIWPSRQPGQWQHARVVLGVYIVKLPKNRANRHPVKVNVEKSPPVAHVFSQTPKQPVWQDPIRGCESHLRKRKFSSPVAPVQCKCFVCQMKSGGLEGESFWMGRKESHQITISCRRSKVGHDSENAWEEGWHWTTFRANLVE